VSAGRHALGSPLVARGGLLDIPGREPLPRRPLPVLYALSRLRRAQPSPSNPTPRSARVVGSGTVLGIFSPLEIGALAEAVVVAN